MNCMMLERERERAMNGLSEVRERLLKVAWRSKAIESRKSVFLS